MDKPEQLLAPGLLQGFNSSVDPSAIPASFAALIQNGRLGDGTLRARNADKSIGNMPASGYVRGFFECSLNGTQTYFVAVGDANPGHIVCYMSTDLSSWTNITPSSGPYGDLRWSWTSDSQYIAFTVARDSAYYGQTPYDLVVMQDGVAAPRIYGNTTTWTSTTTAGLPQTATIDQPGAINGPAISYFYLEPNPFPIGATASTPSTDGSGHVTATNPGAAGTYTWHASFGVATVSGNYAQWVFATDYDWSKDAQVTIMLGNASDTAWLSKIKLSLVDNTGTAAQIYPNATDVILLEPTNAPTGTTWWQMTLAMSAVSGIDTTKIRGLRMTYVYPSVPTSVSTIDVICVAPGGNSDAIEEYGGDYFGLANMSSDSRALGPGTIVPRAATTLDVIGGSSLYSSVSLTEDQRIRGYYWIDWKAGTLGPIDWVNVYRNKPGQSGYYWTGAWQEYHWTGAAWAKTGLWAHPTWVSNSNTSGNISIQSQDTTKVFPDASIICLPVGTCMASCNSRIFVGNGATFYYSWYLMPWMFREAVQFIDATTPNDSSAGSFTKDGETMQQIVPLGFIDVGQESVGAAPNAAASVHYLTDRGFYRISGWDALSLNKSVTVSQYGTIYPFSVARSRNGVYWMDQTGQVRLYNGNTTVPVSLKKVDNYTVGQDAYDWIGAVCREKYYAFSRANGFALVYSEFLEQWESKDSFDQANASWITTANLGGTQKLLYTRNSATSNALVEHDSTTIVVGSTVSLSATFRRVHADYLMQIASSDVYVAADGYTGGTLTVTRVAQGNTQTGITLTSTINLANTSSLSVKGDTLGAGAGWYALQFTVAGTVPSGFKVWSVHANLSRTWVPPMRS